MSWRTYAWPLAPDRRRTSASGTCVPCQFFTLSISSSPLSKVSLTTYECSPSLIHRPLSIVSATRSSTAWMILPQSRVPRGKRGQASGSAADVQHALAVKTDDGDDRVGLDLLSVAPLGAAPLEARSDPPCSEFAVRAHRRRRRASSCSAPSAAARSGPSWRRSPAVSE